MQRLLDAKLGSLLDDLYRQDGAALYASNYKLWLARVRSKIAKKKNRNANKRANIFLPHIQKQKFCPTIEAAHLLDVDARAHALQRIFTLLFELQRGERRSFARAPLS